MAVAHSLGVAESIAVLTAAKIIFNSLYNISHGDRQVSAMGKSVPHFSARGKNEALSFLRSVAPRLMLASWSDSCISDGTNLAMRTISLWISSIVGVIDQEVHW